MRTRLAGLAMLAAALMVAPLEAQGTRFGIGGTGILSLESGGGSDFGFGAAFDYYPGGVWGFRLDGSWVFETGSDLVLFNGDATYNFVTSSPSVHPFLMGGATLATPDDFSDANFGLNLGAGINFHLRDSPVGLWADGRYHHLFDPDFNGLQFMAGIRLGQGE